MEDLSSRREAIRANLEAIKERMAVAARKAGRDPSSVTLLAITKTVPAEVVRLAVELGVTDLGENRVQEAKDKIPLVGPGPIWHFVGRLQTNKAKEAAGLCQLVHSMDRAELAQALNRAGEAAGVPVRVLVQVNVTGAPQQGGVALADVDEFIEMCLRLPYLRMDGVMAIGPHPASDAELREAYRQARGVATKLEQMTGKGPAVVSAGMSGDFEPAIEEGSTMVRIGTALFGDRRQP
ncbi:MAG: YggS family pyridoxal phosphate-dependent enzyme [Candidatus Coatesbacteria bacterium]